jgi:hypothetical protein
LSARFNSDQKKEISMTDAPAPQRPATPARPPSINDNLPTGNPSGKTVLIALGCAIVLVLAWVFFHAMVGR